MSIELPKDAEGREIPLDTRVLYDEEGNRRNVLRFTYTPKRDLEKWDVVFTFGLIRQASAIFLNPPEQPDSWRRTYGESVPMTARGFAGTQTRTRSRTHAPIAANFSRATKSLAVRS